HLRRPRVDAIATVPLVVGGVVADAAHHELGTTRLRTALDGGAMPHGAGKEKWGIRAVLVADLREAASPEPEDADHLRGRSAAELDEDLVASVPVDVDEAADHRAAPERRLGREADLVGRSGRERNSSAPALAAPGLERLRVGQDDQGVRPAVPVEVAADHLDAGHFR